MRMVNRVAVVAMTAGLFIGPVAGAATASAATRAPDWPSQVRLTGGDTSVTTAPGIATALLGHGIVPLATLPGTQGVKADGGGVAIRFTFPVTGGWLNAAQLRGRTLHQGGDLVPRPGLPASRSRSATSSSACIRAC